MVQQWAVELSAAKRALKCAWAEAHACVDRLATGQKAPADRLQAYAQAAIWHIDRALDASPPTQEVRQAMEDLRARAVTLTFVADALSTSQDECDIREAPPSVPVDV